MGTIIAKLSGKDLRVRLRAMIHPERDVLYRFLFEGLDLRGEIVHLDESWWQLYAQRTFPDVVLKLLGETTAAAVLLSALLKMEGMVALQLQGDGPVKLVVAQANHKREIRATAQWKGEVRPGPLPCLFGRRGHLILSLRPEKGDEYQGSVLLEGKRLAEAIETYFERSEQLKTRLWLAADEKASAGLLLQTLPSKRPREEDWRRIEALASTTTEKELLRLSPTEVLRRLFHEETVRLFPPEKVIFRCRCSPERIRELLWTLGRKAAEEALAQAGEIKVTCEFCGQVYCFDREEIEALFRGRGSEEKVH